MNMYIMDLIVFLLGIPFVSISVILVGVRCLSR